MRNIFISFLLFLFFSPGSSSPDLILYNGKIVTVDNKSTIAEAIAIKNGKILSVGTSAKILALKGRNTNAIDLKGKTVIPGLIDAHAHPISASQSEFSQKIPEVHSIQELLQWISEQAAIRPKDEWIVHPKFFITRMREMRQLTLRELDSVAPDHPVFLDGSFGGMVNTRALKLSGLSDSVHPGILRNAETKKPLGLIQSSAFPLLAWKPDAKFTPAQQADMLADLFTRYNSLGITSIISGGGDEAELKLYEDLMRSKKLSVRVFHNMIFPVVSPAKENSVKETLEKFKRKTGDGNNLVKVGAFKVVLDGGVLTGTAYLRKGWGEKAKDVYGINDPAYRGNMFYSKEDLRKIITVATNLGWKFSAHVTGGGAVDSLLDVFQELNTKLDIRGRRFSIIHGNFFTMDAINKMAEMDIYADMQPAWYLKDADLLNRVLDDEQIHTFHPYNSMLEKGIIINGGSDHMVKLDPVESINPYHPFLAMWSMVTRKTERGSVYEPAQAISREEALKCYTINNAKATFEENTKGSLEAGKLADMAVLSNDFLTCPEDSINNIHSVLTIVNGKIVHKQ